MYENKSICVVVPAYNEENLIGRVIETMPEFVDKIVIVDDVSRDRTAEVVQKYVDAERVGSTEQEAMVGVCSNIPETAEHGDDSRNDDSRATTGCLTQAPLVQCPSLQAPCELLTAITRLLGGDGIAQVDQHRAPASLGVCTLPQSSSSRQSGESLAPDASISESSPASRPRLSRIELIRHTVNGGVGAAIATGYKWARDHEYDVTVVMAGDAQMDPGDLPAIVAPVARGEVDYTKGNRLFTGEAWKMIPKVRYLGNSALSLLTKIASGYWHVADSQTGYTAISLGALKTINWDQIYPRYGVPNDILVRLNVYDFRVRDVPVKPVYNIGEKSGIKLWKVIPSLSLLLLKLFLWRMKEKYIIRDFHPLVFFYALACGLLLIAIPLGVRVFWVWGATAVIPRTNALAWFFSVITGLQSLFFAMLFDMEYAKRAR